MQDGAVSEWSHFGQNFAKSFDVISSRRTVRNTFGNRVWARPWYYDTFRRQRTRAAQRLSAAGCHRANYKTSNCSGGEAAACHRRAGISVKPRGSEQRPGQVRRMNSKAPWQRADATENNTIETMRDTLKRKRQ